MCRSMWEEGGGGGACFPRNLCFENDSEHFLRQVNMKMTTDYN